MTGIVLAGAVAGIGLFLLALALQRPQTRGSAAPVALARMDLERSRQREDVDTARFNGGRYGRLGSGTESRSDRQLQAAGLSLRRQLDAVGIRLPAGLRADLSLIGRTVETHLAISVFGAALGAFLVLVFTGVLISVIPALPVSTPILMAVLGAIVGGALPSVQAASRATVRRRDFRHVVGSFLDLVSLNLSGGRGVPEALNSAASISDGWAMVRLRECLQVARLQGVTPWFALGRLGEETGVAELRDLSAALELVADDGAKVRESLAARAASLRRRELADAEGRAEARSQSMLVAQMLLAVGFLIFLIFPAITRVLSS